MVTLLEKHPGVFAFMSERQDGPMERVAGIGDQTRSAYRRNFFAANKIKESAIVASSIVHGANVAVVKDSDEKFYSTADGLVTALSGVCLTITIADCAAVYFWDPEAGVNPKAGVIGICHAGWRGVLGGVVGNTVLKIQELGGVPGRMHCAISPAIGRCCFEVGREVAEVFPGKYSHKNKENAQKYFLDLKSVISDQLAEAGVPSDQIEVHPDCTRCSKKRYFSYRGGDDPAKGNVMVAGIIKQGGYKAAVCQTAFGS